MAKSWKVENNMRRKRLNKKKSNWKIDKWSSSELAIKNEKEEVQTEQQVEKGKLKMKEKIQAYMHVVPFSMRL